MLGRSIRAGLGGIFLLLLTNVARAQCTKDTDCKGDRICEEGACTSPTPPAPAPSPAANGTSDVSTPAGEAAESPPRSHAVPPVPAPAPPPDGPTRASPPRSRSLDREGPAPTQREEPPAQRRSRPAMISGIVMVSIAPLALLGALAAKNSQDSCDDELEQDYPDHILPTSEKYRLERCDSYSTPIYVLGIGGAALAAAGVPLIIYGAKTVPARRTELEFAPWATAHAGGLRIRVRM